MGKKQGIESISSVSLVSQRSYNNNKEYPNSKTTMTGIPAPLTTGSIASEKDLRYPSSLHPTTTPTVGSSVHASPLYHPTTVVSVSTSTVSTTTTMIPNNVTRVNSRLELLSLTAAWKEECDNAVAAATTASSDGGVVGLEMDDQHLTNTTTTATTETDSSMPTAPGSTDGKTGTEDIDIDDRSETDTTTSSTSTSNEGGFIEDDDDEEEEQDVAALADSYGSNSNKHGRVLPSRKANNTPARPRMISPVFRTGGESLNVGIQTDSPMMTAFTSNTGPYSTSSHQNHPTRPSVMISSDPEEDDDENEGAQIQVSTSDKIIQVTKSRHGFVPIRSFVVSVTDTTTLVAETATTSATGLSPGASLLSPMVPKSATVFRNPTTSVSTGRVRSSSVATSVSPERSSYDKVVVFGNPTQQNGRMPPSLPGTTDRPLTGVTNPPPKPTTSTTTLTTTGFGTTDGASSATTSDVIGAHVTNTQSQSGRNQSPGTNSNTVMTQSNDMNNNGHNTTTAVATTNNRPVQPHELSPPRIPTFRRGGTDPWAPNILQLASSSSSTSFVPSFAPPAVVGMPRAEDAIAATNPHLRQSPYLHSPQPTATIGGNPQQMVLYWTHQQPQQEQQNRLASSLSNDMMDSRNHVDLTHQSTPKRTGVAFGCGTDSPILLSSMSVGTGILPSSSLASSASTSSLAPKASVVSSRVLLPPPPLVTATATVAATVDLTKGTTQTMVATAQTSTSPPAKPASVPSSTIDVNLAAAAAAGRENVTLRHQLEECHRTIQSLQQRIEKLENENNQLRQLPVGKISQIPVEDMLDLMQEYGSEVSDTAMPPRRSCVQKASVVRQFRRWNPNFFEYFHHRNGRWIPKLGKEAELRRREEARRMIACTKQSASVGSISGGCTKRKSNNDEPVERTMPSSGPPRKRPVVSSSSAKVTNRK